MRVGVIDVNRLMRVRRTFRPGWRVLTILTFLMFVFFWWGVFNRLPTTEQVASDNGLKLQLLTLALVLLPTLGVALFKKNGFARLTFALITLVNLLTWPLFVLVLAVVVIPTLQPPDRSIMIMFVGLALGLVVVFWDLVVAHTYVLFLSVMPFGRAKAFRNQVASSLLLCSGRWKSRDNEELVKGGEKLRSIDGSPYRLILGGIWFILGAICLLMSGFGMINSEFLPAVFHLQLAKGWYQLQHFEITDPTSSTLTEQMLGVTYVILLLFLGFGCFFVYGYFWTQWLRENTLVFRGSILQHLTSSDVLLLRTFKDDLKSVPREQRIWLTPFRVYAWAYTFEQLIAERLRYIGKVRLLDIDHENKELLEKRWLTSLVTPARLKRFLISIFPVAWYKLPPKGGIRYYVDTRQDPMVWQPEVVQAMRTARMIVVLLGTTESLAWEMEQIQNFRLLEKTIFLMPPAAFKQRQYRVRWHRFLKYLNENGGFDTELLKKVKPKRVRAVCVHQDTLLIITGKWAVQSFYEPALDIATLFTVADPAYSRSMISKYLT